MTRFATQTVALLAAVLATMASLNAIVTVPPTNAVTYAAPILA